MPDQENPTYYTGIGSRQTPPEFLDYMRVIGYVLAKSGLVLRSGAAEGADSAFEHGCDLAKGKKQIFLPWNLFNERQANGQNVFSDPSEAAMELASHIHPAWSGLSAGAKKLHARNCHQVLGPDIYALQDISRFIICWTPGTGQGGTEQALRLARHYNVPIIKLEKTQPDTMLLSVFRTIGCAAMNVRPAFLE